MKKKITITESQLNSIIKSSIAESVYGIKNPVDEYQINPQEIIQKCEEFRTYFNAFKEYIDGVDEECEEGEQNQGVRFNVSMKNMWTDDWKIQELSQALTELSSLFFKINSGINEVIDAAETLSR